ncbi:MAG: hypothetical protein ACYDH8_06310 [Syntrophales bacterium]
MTTNKDQSTISYLQLGLLIIAFFIGVIADQIVRNTLGAETIQFSTLSLMGFLFSILIGGASIVLAVAAIQLGKISEQTMVQRSDQSIKLQSDIFVKTTDALQRIESSTGVTEKRIEDIITGRAGDISHNVAELALADRGGMKDRKLLEQEIKDSILRQIKGEPAVKQDQAALQLLKERRERYQQFHSKILSIFANLNKSIAIKLGSGAFVAEGAELYDGIFDIGEKKVGVCALGQDHEGSVFARDFLNSILTSLTNNVVDGVAFVFDVTKEERETLQIKFQKELDFVKDELRNRIIILIGQPDEIQTEIQKIYG